MMISGRKMGSGCLTADSEQRVSTRSNGDDVLLRNAGLSLPGSEIGRYALSVPTYVHSPVEIDPRLEAYSPVEIDPRLEA